MPREKVSEKVKKPRSWISPEPFRERIGKYREELGKPLPTVNGFGLKVFLDSCESMSHDLENFMAYSRDLEKRLRAARKDRSDEPR